MTVRVAPGLVVCGATSDAGKSWVVTGLCRLLARQGLRVAPFKAQNMALNAAVTADGAEIGHAQWVQALAAGVEAEAAMNPILLKPTGERTSQVVVLGKARGERSAAEYHATKTGLRSVVADALGDLRRRFDVVICEGAGGAAEINLLAGDLANLPLARDAGLPAVVVGDIERGGVFASLYGTVMLLPDDLRRCVAGFVVNRFRGDRALLGDACAELERRCGVPTLGVVPRLPGLDLDAEDSHALDHWDTEPTPTPGGGPGPVLDVVAVRFPRVANFGDLDPLRLEPAVGVRWVRSAAELGRPDLVVLPGSKNTREDLAWLRASGLAEALAGLVAGGPTVLVAVCAGAQMAGDRIEDPDGAEGPPGSVDGLGWLPLTTRFRADKVLDRPSGRVLGGPGAGQAVAGYRIHHGRVAPRHGGGAGGRVEPWIVAPDGAVLGWRGGPGGRICATTLHGLFDDDGFRAALLDSLAGGCPQPRASFAAARAARFDRIADTLAAHVDLDRLFAVMGLDAGLTGRPGMILVVANNDLDLLALRVAVEELPEGFPPVRAFGRVGLAADEDPPPLDGVRAVIVRLLKGRTAWENPFDRLRDGCLARGVPLLAFGGEAAVDAELTRLSTVPAGILTTASGYLVRGGPANLAGLLRFVADTVLLEGFGFDAPRDVPAVGVLGDRAFDPARPTVAVVTYRAGVLAGDTLAVEQLCDALEARGVNARAVWCYSLRAEPDGRPPEALALLAGADVVVTTTWAAGGVVAEGDARRAAGPESTGWASPLDGLDVPVLQVVASTGPTSTWASGAGLSPLDVALAVAIPEFDGRIIGPPLSFKEVVDDGDELGLSLSAHRAVPDRVERIAGLATRLARLRHVPPAQKRVAIVLSAYPTKRARIGNAVALDTPASLLRLLGALRDAGYELGEELGRDLGGDVGDEAVGDGVEAALAAGVEAALAAGSDALMARLADGLTYDLTTLTADQLARSVGGLDVADYDRWFADLPADLRERVTDRWGPAPGGVCVHGGPDGEALRFAGVRFGNVVVAVQPPRGFGADPIGTYHDPELPPPHHYLAFYRWLEEGFGADAVVHLGKHGTLEWLPGKGTGPSGSCIPDAALGDLPLLYPFVVNDPGEGTQAKRRTHAVIVDHLPPPMTRAETYDDLARVERLLDEYAKVEALDPAKLPTLQGQLWDLLVTSELARDLGVAAMPDPDDFAGMINHVDGYLCALKDAQIRGGLHVLGAPPEGEALLDAVLAICRQPQGGVPSLREAVAAELGVDVTSAGTVALDRVEDACRALLETLAAAGWSIQPGAGSGGGSADVEEVLRWVAERLVPALGRTGDEVDNLLAGLAGRHVPSGPSGAPTRGGAHVLPTGRNFHAIDPKAVPSPLAWDVGRTLAERLVERHVAETGAPPRTVGLVVWGTATMRTQGDDVAEALALLGVRPRWHAYSGRVEGLEVLSLAELGRPRVDVTLRISGFFRDAFPEVVDLLDEAVELVAACDEEPAQNPVRAAGTADPRVYGPAPGTYGAGIFEAIETRSWRSRGDLAEVYLAWSGYGYRRGSHGVAAPEAVRRRFAAIDVAVKNQDNREHDIFDGDDYFQDHGGMVAAIAALSGREPRAWFGDSSDPARPTVRSLAEEAARVVRTRVLNPKWLAAMRRHGYKGAFEVAATVDYLFGYDATAGVVEDWMYERVTQAYVADPEMRDFYERSNPWALRGICERLLEAADRGLWDASAEARATLRDGLLAAEGREERLGEGPREPPGELPAPGRPAPGRVP